MAAGARPLKKCSGDGHFMDSTCACRVADRTRLGYTKGERRECGAGGRPGVNGPLDRCVSWSLRGRIEGRQHMVEARGRGRRGSPSLGDTSVQMVRLEIAIRRWYDVGDHDAFAVAVALFRELWPRAFARVGDGDAEDAMQAFLVERLVERRRRALLPRNPDVPFRAHVARVLRNAETSRWRKLRPHVPYTVELAGSADDPYTYAFVREARHYVQRALDTVPVRPRVAYILMDRLYHHDVDLVRYADALAVELLLPRHVVLQRLACAVASGDRDDAIVAVYPQYVPGAPGASTTRETFARVARRGRDAVRDELTKVGVSVA